MFILAVMGLWSGTISFGNILGTGIVAATLSIMGDHLGWKWAMVFSGLFVVFFCIWVFLQLTPHPTDVGLPDPNHTVVVDARKDDELEALVEDSHNLNTTLLGVSHSLEALDDVS